MESLTNTSDGHKLNGFYIRFVPIMTLTAGCANVT